MGYRKPVEPGAIMTRFRRTFLSAASLTCGIWSLACTSGSPPSAAPTELSILARSVPEPGVRWLDVALDGRGSLWALTDAQHPLRSGRVDSTGQIQWTPLAVPADLTGALELFPVVAREDVVGVWNTRSGGLAFVDALGRTVDELPVPVAQSSINASLLTDGFIRPVRAHAWGSRLLLPWIRADIMREADLWYTDLIVGDLEAGGLRTIVDFDEGIPPGDVARLRRMAWPSVPYWAACTVGIVWYNPIAGEVAWVDLDGVVMARRVVASRGTKLGSHDLRRFSHRRVMMRPAPTESLIQDRDSRYTEDATFNALRKSVGSRGPAFVDLYCDGQSRAWLQSFDVSGTPPGHGSSWIVVDTAGAITALQLPPGFSPRSHFGNVVAGIQLDSTGQSSVALARWADLPISTPPTH